MSQTDLSKDNGQGPNEIVIGIDVGSSKSVIAYGPAENATYVADLAPNEMSNLSTPSMCSFQGSQRFIGESAAGMMGTNSKNTIPAISRLIGIKKDQFEDSHAQYTTLADANGCTCAQVDYMDSPLSLRPEQLVGMLMHQLAARAKQEAGNAVVRSCVVALPAELLLTRPAAVEQIAAAARIAGLPQPQVVRCDAAAASCLSVKHALASSPSSSTAPEPPQQQEGDDDTSKEKKVMFVDMGADSTSLAVYTFTAAAPVLVPTSLKTLPLGGEVLARRLWGWAAGEVEKTGGGEVKPASRGGQRLMQECYRCIRTLSTVQLARIELECFGPNDKDITIQVTRDQFEALCSREREQLTAALTAALQGSGVTGSEISQVELTGGATRTPWVRSLISSSVCERLSYMLDSTAANAFGAVFIAQHPTVLQANPQAPGVVPTGGADEAPAPADAETASWRMSEDDVAAAAAVEERMQKEDEKQAKLADARNDLEGYILEMRSACSREAELAGGAAAVEAAEDWMYSEDGETADLAALSARRADLEAELRSQFPQYFERVKADKERVEAELSAQAAIRQEQEKNEEKDDHDTRKLAKPERMRLLKLNKDEGTELFKGKNLEAAIVHWRKALQHASKFFDLTPQDTQEVEDLKVALYLNIAMAYLKAELPEALPRVVTNCEEALALRPQNVKALFRRAQARERMREFDAARKDLLAARELDDQDTAITKLLERVDAQIARQVAKEKQMYGKMFG